MENAEQQQVSSLQEIPAVESGDVVVLTSDELAPCEHSKRENTEEDGMEVVFDRLDGLGY